MAYVQTAKDPSLLLTEKYYETLNGAVTYKGEEVPVYDFISPEAEYPYIWISTQNADQDNFANDKEGWAWSYTQLIEIIMGYAGNMYGGKYDVQTMQAQVIPLIVKQEQWEIEPFLIMNTEVDSTNLLSETTDAFTVYRQQIRFRHLIWQEG